MAFLLAGCGTVHFVDSPYMPQNVRLVLSAQENLSIITWQLVGDVDPSEVRFELKVNGVWQPIDFQSALYPAGQFDCTSTCFQYNLAGLLVAPTDNVIVRSIHPIQGVIYGAAATQESPDHTLSFNPRLQSGNAQAEVNVVDAFTQLGAPAPRQFRWQTVSMSPACPSTTMTWAGTTSGTDVVPFTGMLDPMSGDGTGSACMLLQPVPQHAPATYQPVTLSARMPAHPVLFSDRTHFDAPVENSPVLYQFLLDLDIPDASHCDATLELIQQIIGKALDARNAEHYAFPVVNLGDNGVSHCSGDPSRHFDPTQLAGTIGQYVDANVPEHDGARVVVIYVNNSLLPVTSTLIEELQALQAALGADPRVGSYFWLIGSADASTGLSWDETTAWITPTNSAFSEQVTSIANRTLPFETIPQDPPIEAPLLSAAFEAQARAMTSSLKICGFSPTSVVILDNGMMAAFNQASGAPTFVFTPNHNYSFEVSFETEQFVPHSQFKPQAADIRYELCTNFCSDAFQFATGEWSTDGWAPDVRCREAP